MSDANHKLEAEIADYYNRGREAARLEGGKNQLERLRTQELLIRFLPLLLGFTMSAVAQESTLCGWQNAVTQSIYSTRCRYILNRLEKLPRGNLKLGSSPSLQATPALCPLLL